VDGTMRVWGVPLVSVGANARGIFAFGNTAVGVVAVGNVARGIFAFGNLAMGAALSVGNLSVGMVAFGNVAIGPLFAFGATLGLGGIGGSGFVLSSGGSLRNVVAGTPFEALDQSGIERIPAPLGAILAPPVWLLLGRITDPESGWLGWILRWLAAPFRGRAPRGTPVPADLAPTGWVAGRVLAAGGTARTLTVQTEDGRVIEAELRGFDAPVRDARVMVELVRDAVVHDGTGYRDAGARETRLGVKDLRVTTPPSTSAPSAFNAVVAAGYRLAALAGAALLVWIVVSMLTS
jgi:hypothetical protein